MNLKHIGSKIREARENLGITQEELAMRIGKTQNAISGYENGSRGIHISELPDLASALGVPVSYFFDSIKTDVDIQLNSIEYDIIVALRRGEKMKAINIISSS